MISEDLRYIRKVPKSADFQQKLPWSIEQGGFW